MNKGKYWWVVLILQPWLADSFCVAPTRSKNYQCGIASRDSRITFVGRLSSSLLFSSSSNTVGESSKKKKTRRKEADQQQQRRSKQPRKTASVASPNRPHWEFAWLQGKEREDYMSETVKQEEILIRQFDKVIGPNLKNAAKNNTLDLPEEEAANDNPQFSQWCDRGLNILTRWSQLGEGQRCARLAQSLVDRFPNATLSDKKQCATFAIKAHRRSLFANLNELKRISWNFDTKQPPKNPLFFRGKFQKQQQSWRLQQRAQQIMSGGALVALRRLEAASRDHVKLMTRKTKGVALVPMTLMTRADYDAYIRSQCFVGNPVDALYALRQLENHYEASNHLQRLVPTQSLYIAIMRAIVQQQQQQPLRKNNNNDWWHHRMGVKHSPSEMVDLLAKNYMRLYESSPATRHWLDPPNLVMMSLVLDSWSRAIPATNHNPFNNNRDNPLALIEKSDEMVPLQNQKTNIANQVRMAWDSFQLYNQPFDKDQPEDEIYNNPQNTVENCWQPDNRCFISMIYTFCKTDYLDDAYSMFEYFMDHLERTAIPKKKPSDPNMDRKAFITLMNKLACSIPGEKSESRRQELASRVETVLRAMSKIQDELGYKRMSPDLFLYTTAMSAWANAACSQSAERAQGIMNELKRRGPSLGGPDVAAYNALLLAHAKQPQANVQQPFQQEEMIQSSSSGTSGITTTRVDVAWQVQEIVRAMEKDAATTKPNIETYEVVIQTYIQSNRADKAVETLNDLISDPNKPDPRERTFETIISDIARLGHSVYLAEQILHQRDKFFPPSPPLHMQIVEGWCREGTAEGAKRAKELLEIMINKSKQKDSDDEDDEDYQEEEEEEALATMSAFKPNRSLFNLVIQACRDQGLTASAMQLRDMRDEMYNVQVVVEKFENSQQVFDLLRMVDSKLVSHNRPIPSTINFNKVIHALANSGMIWAGQRAEDILTYMLELGIQRKNNAVLPDIITFNSVMAAWAKSGHTNAGEYAEQILHKLQALHKMGHLEDVLPDRFTYNTLISAHARSDLVGSPVLAEAAFQQLEQLYNETGNPEYMPDSVSYSTLLSAWSNSGQEGAARKAEQVLIKMRESYRGDPKTRPRPNILCYNEVLFAWARSKERSAADRADLLLRVLEESKQVNPDVKSYNIVLLAIANSKAYNAADQVAELFERLKKKDNVRPNLTSYNRVMAAFIKKGGPENMDRAMEYFDEALSDPNVEFTSDFFVALLNEIAISIEPDIAERADDIVAQVRDLNDRGVINVPMDTQMYNAYAKCWCRSGHPHAPDRVENILYQMMQKGKQDKRAAPDAKTFTIAIDAWAKSQDPDATQRAEILLDRMPIATWQAYTALMQCYARSDLFDKALRARAILERMKRDYESGNQNAKPNIAAYNVILNAAEFSADFPIPDAKVAFQLACDIFDEACNSKLVEPDHLTYGSFMGVVKTLLPESKLRTDMIHVIFRRSCINGMVGRVLMKKLRRTASLEQYEELVGGMIPYEKLPEDWVRNVRETEDYEWVYS